MGKRNRSRRAQVQNQIAASTVKSRMTKAMGEKIKDNKKKLAKVKEAEAEQQERPTINLPLTIEQYQLIDAMVSMAMQKGDKKLLLPLAQLHITMQKHGQAFEKEMQRKAVLKEMADEEKGPSEDDKLLKSVKDAVKKPKSAPEADNDAEGEGDGEE